MNTPIHAVVIGHNTCTAEGITAHGFAPVLALCRKLIAAGHDPATPLIAYRGDAPALRLRTIRDGARLMVGDNNSGTPVFRRWHDAEAGRVGASLVRQTVPDLPNTRLAA